MAAARTFRPWLWGAVAGLALVVATLPLPWRDPDFDLDPLVRVAMAVSGAAQLVMVDRARDRTSVTTATGVLGATTLAYPLILGLSAADVGAPLTTALSTFWHTIPLTLLQVVPLLASSRAGARPLRGWLRAVVAIAIVGSLLTGWFVLGGPGAGVVGPLSTLLWFGSFLLAPIATWRNIRGTAGEMRRRAIVAALAALLPIAVVGWCVALGVIGTEAGWSDDFSVGALMVGFALGTATCSLLALGAVSQPASRMVRTRVVVVALNIVLATIVGIAACTGTLLAARAGLPAGGMFAIGALAAIAVGAPWVRLHRWIVRVVDPAAELRHEVSALGRIDDGAQRQSVLLVLRRVTDDPDLMLTYDPPPDGGAQIRSTSPSRTARAGVPLSPRTPGRRPPPSGSLASGTAPACSGRRCWSTASRSRTGRPSRLPRPNAVGWRRTCTTGCRASSSGSRSTCRCRRPRSRTRTHGCWPRTPSTRCERWSTRCARSGAAGSRLPWPTTG